VKINAPFRQHAFDPAVGTSQRMATKMNRPLEIQTLTNAGGMAAR
jgi:hypothetical protein